MRQAALESARDHYVRVGRDDVCGALKYYILLMSRLVIVTFWRVADSRDTADNLFVLCIQSTYNTAILWSECWTISYFVVTHTFPSHSSSLPAAYLLHKTLYYFYARFSSCWSLETCGGGGCFGVDNVPKMRVVVEASRIIDFVHSFIRLKTTR